MCVKYNNVNIIWKKAFSWEYKNFFSYSQVNYKSCYYKNNFTSR